MEATALIGRRRRPRQYRTIEEKRLVVEQTLKPGVSAAAVAQGHGVNANQVFHWRKLYEAGQLEIPMAKIGQHRRNSLISRRLGEADRLCAICCN